MKEFIIDSNNFNNLDGFYSLIENVFTNDMSFNMGHNLDALYDVFQGGFGVFDVCEKITIRWINHSKSINDLGHIMFSKILNVFYDCENIKLELE